MVVEKGARLENCKVRGPAVIGRDTVVKDAYIGPYTSIGEDAPVDDEREQDQGGAGERCRRSSGEARMRRRRCGIV